MPNSFIRNPKDFWSGAIFTAFGLGAIVIGLDYSMGTAGRMGPGYFPTFLGGLLVLVGLVSMARSCFRTAEPIGKFAIMRAALILGATVAFGVLIRTAGLFVAIFALVIIGGLASSRFRTVPFLILAIGLAAFSVAVFVFALGVPMPLVGSWFKF